MADSTWKEDLAGRARICRTINGAMLSACLAFLAVVLALTLWGKMPASDTAPILTLMAVAMSVMVIVAWIVAPRAIAARARRALIDGNLDSLPTPGGRLGRQAGPSLEEGDERERLAAVFASQNLVGAALLEGGCFVNLVFHLIEQHPVTLGLALLMIVLMAAGFPTRDRMAEWIEAQLRAVAQERSFGR